MNIDRISIYLTSVPLKQPYELSFSTVSDLESIFVKIIAGDKVGWGESTPLPGYTSDSKFSVYSNAEILSREIIGKNLEDAKRIIGFKDGFSRSAPMLAIEMLSGEITWTGQTKKVPLVSLIKSKSRDTIRDEVATAFKNGNHTLKYKIGGNVADDLERASHILYALPDGAKVRFDANQGYSFTDAVKFVDGLCNSKKVELIEQPLKVQEWSGTRRLSQHTDIPIMLDESILTEKDIIKAVEAECFSYIKLKLFKCGSYKKTERLISLALENELKVIIGNGVSTALGCFLESKLWDKTSELKLAGEMNGYLKVDMPVINDITEDRGMVIYKDQNIADLINESVLAKYTVSKKELYL